MGSRYLVVNADLRREPEVVIQTDEINTATMTFKELAMKSLDRSIILYDSQEDKVSRAFMQSEPIILVRAIELARKRTNHILFMVRCPDTMGTGELKTDESKLINLIVKKLSDPDTNHGIRNFEHEYIIAPYYAFELDGGGLAGAAAGIYGALSGSVFGFVTGGPPGAVFGGILGAFGLITGTKYLFKTMHCPNKCLDCKGSGLKGNNFRCINCDGYGFTKETI